MQDLHYGYWTDDLELTPQNLPRAQARYTDELTADIPAGVRSILDVGCGAGNTARKLLERGYEVDCVSPNAWLTAEARKVLGNHARVFESKFEDLTLDRTYDLILFSESSLFMKAVQALAKAATPAPARRLHPHPPEYSQTPPTRRARSAEDQDLRRYRALLAASHFTQLEAGTDMTANTACGRSISSAGPTSRRLAPPTGSSSPGLHAVPMVDEAAAPQVVGQGSPATRRTLQRASATVRTS